MSGVQCTSPADRNASQPYSVDLRLALYHAGAATFLLFNRTAHPSIEANHGLRKDGLAEERDSMEQEGRDIKESSGRKLTRSAQQAARCLYACSRLCHNRSMHLLLPLA